VIPLSIPSPPPEWQSFDLGSWIHSWLPIWPEDLAIVIYAYALCILIGITAAVLLSNHRLTKRGGEPWIIIDISLWAIAFGLVGARIWHVVTHPDDYFGPGKDLLKVLYVWEGGVAIFGAVLGGAIGVAIACRIAGLRFTAVMDVMAPTLLLAQASGRVGNYFNQELFGLPTDLPWGLEIDRPNSAVPSGIPDDALFHPIFLYEIVWLLAGLAVLLLIENRVRLGKVTTFPRRYLPPWPEFTRRDSWHWGKMTGLYLIWYGVGRSWFESIRLDPSETLLGIRSNVWGALAAIVVGLVILIVQTKAHPGVEPGVYKPGKQWKTGPEVDSEDLYQELDESGETAADPATSGVTRTQS
jgi:prolipoprotein diacylglyceryl transferase